MVLLRIHSLEYIRCRVAAGGPMAADVLLVEVAEGIATLTEVLNALDDAVRARLDDLLATVEQDPAVGAVILTGAGDRAFVSGADIRALAAKGDRQSVV